MVRENSEIDRNSATPMYIQLRNIVLDELQGGNFLPGEKFYSEGEFAKRYGISRMTVRKVMDDLDKDGFLQRIPGKGTFVSRPKIMERLTNLIGFTQDMLSKGHTPSSKLLKMVTIKASNKIQAILELPDHDKMVILLKRLRCASGEPVAIQTAYIPHRIFPRLTDFDMEKESLYAVFQKIGHPPAWAKQDMEAVVANQELGEQLGIPKGSPCLLSERTTYDKDDIPIERNVTHFRGDRCRFTVNLINPYVSHSSPLYRSSSH